MDLRSLFLGIIIGLVVGFGVFSLLGNRYEVKILGKPHNSEKFDLNKPQSHLVGVSICRLNKLTGNIRIYVWGTGRWYKLEQ